MSERISGPSEIIRRHPITSFFFFTFLISWTAWFLAPIATPLSEHLSSFIDQVGSFSPALSAILVSTVLNPAPSKASTTKRRNTFAIIFTLAILIQIAATIAVGGQVSYQTIIFATFGALIAAYVVSSVCHPKQGVSDLLARLKPISARSVWLWIALLLPFAWQFSGAAIDLSLGGNERFSLTPTALASLAAYYPFIAFFGGGLNEEPGWRGFAVPHLHRTYSPLVAGLIIGVIWSTWHFPLHATSTFGGGIAGFPFRFVYNVPLGVLFSWLYNKSGGNLLACVLLHASYNSAGTIFGDNAALISTMLMIAFTVTVALHDRMWQKNPTLQDNKHQPNEYRKQRSLL
jgi:membrane protease YdiL (CAAX protease family)